MIYFDNSATTKTSEFVAREFYNDLTSDELFANPGSIHKIGVSVDKAYSAVKDDTAKLLGCKPDEVLFTSCGTEGSNTAILGYLSRNKRAGNTVISTRTEHKATLETLKKLESMGYVVKYVSINPDGKPNLEELESMIDSNVALMCFTYVNNETGSILPIGEIVTLKNKLNSKTAVFLDCVQALGKINVNLAKLGVDLATFSGHKIHGVKGVGVLYVKGNTRIDPLVIGGGQQGGMRSGTVSYALANSFCNALKETCEKLQSSQENITKVNAYLREELIKREAVINSPDDASVFILNVAFKGFQSETMLHCLESEDIYVSTVSACSSKTKKASYVLLEMGIKREIANNSVRLSFSGDNTMDEAIEFITKLDKIYELYLIK